LKLVILDGDTLGEDLDLSLFSQFGEVTIYGKTSPAERIERVADSDIVITNKVVIDRDVMRASPNLKLISITATGMNNVDLEEAKNRGIVVKNVAGYSTESVVQHTFATLLYLLENLNYHDNFVKSGDWRESKLFTNVSKPFFEISGKRFGIIGLGTIGERVGEVAEAFGAEVIYFSTSGKNSSNKFKRVELDELLKTSQIVSIHSPLNERTSGLLNRENINLLQDNSILLNMGRGGIIDERDLAEAIEKQKIYVGLDVTSKEPLPEDNPLSKVLDRENLFITPHIAWTSIEAREKLLAGVIEGIRDFLS
jgi:lactate dehydrogenase-like 2-hydroxyacid dehydrogenase